MVPGVLEWCNLELQHQELLVRVLFHQLCWLLKCPSFNAILQLIELKEFGNFGKIKHQIFSVKMQ